MSSTTTRLSGSQLTPEPHPEVFDEYRDHLRGLGFTETSVRDHGRFVRHFLIWLDADDITLDSIDGNVVSSFFRHDCGCDLPFSKAIPSDSGYSVGPVTRFVRFLEETGRTFHLEELDQNLGLLDQFLQQSRENGYSHRALNVFRSTSRHFIVWLHHFRIPLGQLDSEVASPFRTA